jgi:hypothetical protein
MGKREVFGGPIRELSQFGTVPFPASAIKLCTQSLDVALNAEAIKGTLEIVQEVKPEIAAHGEPLQGLQKIFL